MRVLWLGELVVRGSPDDAAFEPRNRVAAERGAERARRVDVALDTDRIVGWNDGRPCARRDCRRALVDDVAHEHVCPGVREELGQSRSDVPYALDEHGAPLELGGGERGPAARSNPVK